MNGTDAARLHADSIVIDGLNASHFLDERVLERLHRGGVTAVNATVAAWHSPVETLEMIAAVGEQIEAHADIVMQVRTVADIAAAKASKRVGLILGFQDVAPVGDDLRLLATYHRLGVRVVQLTYNFANRVGAGCLASEDGGLTPFGREAVREMNRLGILMDVSHCGAVTTLDAIAVSEKPIAITHANPRRFFDHPRNKSDEAIRAMACRGGVIGAVAFGAMLTRRLPATLDDYVAAIDDLVLLAGVDHVGLGPDFMEEMPDDVAAQVLKGTPPEILKQFQGLPPTQGFESVAAFANVTAALLNHGYQPDEVRRLIGGNWLRLYTQVWDGG
ncbi:MAG: dipeptidase [Nitrososphaerales archaeon]